LHMHHRSLSRDVDFDDNDSDDDTYMHHDI